MRKIVLVTSALAMLGFGLGGANAYNASDAFGPSDRNDLPVTMKQAQTGTSVSGFITSSAGSDPVHRGYNAAADFGSSSQNDLPLR